MKQISLLLVSTLLSTASVAHSNHASTRSNVSLDTVRNAFKAHTTQSHHDDNLAIVYGGADVALDENSQSQFIPV